MLNQEIKKKMLNRCSSNESGIFNEYTGVTLGKISSF